MSNHSTTVALRFRSIQPFARLSTTTDERQSDYDQGIVTYDDDGHYQVTSLRIGLRSDHVGDLLGSQSEMLSTSSPLDEDRELLLDSDSKGLILTRRDGDNVRHLDGDARKADRKDQKATLESVRRSMSELGQADPDTSERSIEATI
jgi:hypothetical protein